jgi:heterotetrameric sarcosine oxidase gamma subunit
MSESTLAARPGFHDLLRQAGEGRGVIVTERAELGLATVIARKGGAVALAARLKERLGVDLPAGPRRETSNALSLMGTGPGTWLATHEQGTTGLLSALRENIGDLAAVSDQSDGYAVLRLTGPEVREALAKLVFIDLHPGAFGVGHVACTVAGHTGITLWRLEDGPDGAIFELALYRSFAASFWHALSASFAGQSTCDRNARVRSSFG